MSVGVTVFSTLQENPVNPFRTMGSKRLYSNQYSNQSGTAEATAFVSFVNKENEGFFVFILNITEKKGFYVVMKLNGSEILLECLLEQGVDTVFGYPGGSVLNIYDALYKYSDKITHILTAHEQGACHAADGYARSSGRTGVVIATSGPGATNLVTGIATAYMDSIPLVAITGNVPVSLLGLDSFQEVDIAGITMPVTKHNYIVKDVRELADTVREAFYIANTGRKGPVLIDVPIDVQNAPVRKFKYPDSVSMRTYKPTVKGHIVQIKKVIAELEKAKRPVICAGGGVLLGDAQKLLQEFSHRHKIPVVTTMMGIGAMQTEDPLYFGMVGNNGAPCANRAMNEADMIIMVGARVADRAVNQPEIITKNKVLVHMDVDPAEIGKNAGPTIPLVGDAKHIFSDMLEQELDGDYSEWVVCLQEYEKTMADTRKPDPAFVDPAEFVRRLSDKMEQDAVYVADVGQNQIWSCRNCKIREGSFLTSGGMGTMGYSIPAAMGAKLGAPGRQVVAVCGDGSFQMSMMEFATMRQYQVPVKIVVIANHYLGMVREYQQNTYKGRYSVVELGGGPDLEKLAQAYGMDFIRLEAPDKMDEAIDAFLKDEDAVLMECVINPMDTVK